MTVEEARADLMVAQADVSYRPKDDSIDMAIKALEQETKWIPVSERLPESDGDYFLFGKVVEDDDTENIFIGMYDACAEKFGYWEDYYDRNTLGFLDSELIEYNKVIAWMPLPEPYKAESEDKE